MFIIWMRVLVSIEEKALFPNLKFYVLQRQQTALHIAAEFGRQDIAEMILIAGVDLRVLDKVLQELPANAKVCFIYLLR